MTDQSKLEDFLGDTVKAAFAEQERVIGTLPAGSHLLELPDFAKWLVVEPDEEAKTLTLKAITADGRLVTLDPPKREFSGDWRAKWDARAKELEAHARKLGSAPSIRQESEAE